MHNIDEDLVERARALVPLLREHSSRAEEQRCLTPETVRALNEAGLFDMLKPRRYGGRETDLRTVVRVQEELGRGCGSAAWVVGQINASAWMVSVFPAPLRNDVFAAPDAHVALVQYGKVTLEAVSGGYRVSGVWPFCSGCKQSSWVIAGTTLAGPEGKPAPVMMAIPTRELEILDDWHTSGLRATGSHSVAAHQVFVPDTRVAPLVPAIVGQTPPADLDGSLYRGAFLPLTLLTSASPSLGLARAMLDEFKEQLPARPLASTAFSKRIDAPMTHRQVGQAAMKLEVARLVLQRAADAIMAAGERGTSMPREERIRAVVDVGFAVSECQQLVDALMGISGANALYWSNPLQRIARDMRALSAHPSFAIDSGLEHLGRCVLGLPATVPII